MRRTTKNVYVSPHLSTIIIRVCCHVCAWHPLPASGQDSLWQWEVCPAPSYKEKDQTREERPRAQPQETLDCLVETHVPFPGIHAGISSHKTSCIFLCSLLPKRQGVGQRGTCSRSVLGRQCAGHAPELPTRSLPSLGSGSSSSDVTVEEWSSGAIRRILTVTRLREEAHDRTPSSPICRDRRERPVPPFPS